MKTDLKFLASFLKKIDVSFWIVLMWTQTKHFLVVIVKPQKRNLSCLIKEPLGLIFKGLSELDYLEKNNKEKVFMTLELRDVKIFLTAKLQSFWDKAFQLKLVQSCFGKRLILPTTYRGDESENAYRFLILGGFSLTGVKNETRQVISSKYSSNSCWVSCFVVTNLLRGVLCSNRQGFSEGLQVSEGGVFWLLAG